MYGTTVYYTLSHIKCGYIVICLVIQGILESVRWLRKQNTDQEGRRPGMEGGPQSGLFGDRKHQDISQ